MGGARQWVHEGIQEQEQLQQGRVVQHSAAWTLKVGQQGEAAGRDRVRRAREPIP